MVCEALAQSTAHAAAVRLLTCLVEAYTTPGRPPGCLSVQAGLASDADSRAVVELLATVRNKYRQAVQERFEKAVVNGDLLPDTDSEALARLLMVTAEGLAIHAVSGASREELMSAADLAVQLVPAT
ncbi:TetR family transcriptional regulator C-terminal domain-containing protein [Streptomyces fuscichromogenes]|uniref:Tetracyclin repressor-like C-terminal domain-containing protein n=1 Tax=Streptomyces fuscichromogenes TaxID=1324013 RepID=A0A917XGM8_9ACTN|nr:hypothetical protein [Streptomyces fuscichromogenes]GGN23274.1 hypothetical protein GCM10011578_055420 [Streptomyces fuscichromogenes]